MIADDDHGAPTVTALVDINVPATLAVTARKVPWAAMAAMGMSPMTMPAPAVRMAMMAASGMNVATIAMSMMTSALITL